MIFESVFLSPFDGTDDKLPQGEIKTNHQAEQVFKGAAPEVVFVRPCYFMENWASAVGTASSEAAFFFSTVTPLDFQMPMVRKAPLITLNAIC